MSFSFEVEMKISVLRSVGDEQNAFPMASPRLFTSAPAEAGRARGRRRGGEGGGCRFSEVLWEG